MMLRGDTVRCAVCDSLWGTDDHDACPNCGSTEVWDMEAAMREAGLLE